MIKKTITYDDFLGLTRTEDHYFNISKAELVEWNLIENNTLFDTLTQISETQDGAQLVPMFKKILGMGYGRLSEDGRRFTKPEGAWEEFLETGAWEALLFELISDADFAATFMNGLIPAVLVAQAQKEADEQRAQQASSGQPAAVVPTRPQPQDRLQKQAPSSVQVLRTPAEAVAEKTTPQPTVEPTPGELAAQSANSAPPSWAQLSPDQQRELLAQLGGGNTDGSTDRPKSDGLSRPPHESGLTIEG